MKHLLVTGASGLLGLNLALAACDQGYTVTGVVHDHKLSGAPFAVHLAPEKVSLAGVKRDIIVVNVTIVDEKGRMVPTADNEVSFQIAGPAKIIGVGNGCPSSHEADHASHRRAFNGCCQAILQVNGQAGEIILSVTAPGLHQDRVVLE